MSWSELPTNLRTVLGAALLLVIGVAVASFTLSFIALREVASAPVTGWGRNAWIFPLCVDAALLASEVVLVGVSMIKGVNRAVPFTFMVALAWLLVFALTGHRDGGGWRRLLRMLGEYAAVATLAVLLVTGPAASAPHQPTDRATAGAAGELCPDAIHGIASSACDLIGDVWHAANQARQKATAPTTTTPTGKDSR